MQNKFLPFSVAFEVMIVNHDLSYAAEANSMRTSRNYVDCWLNVLRHLRKYARIQTVVLEFHSAVKIAMLSVVSIVS